MSSTFAATSSALLAAACTAIVVRAATKEQEAHTAKEKRLHLLGTLGCSLLVVLFVLLTVVNIREDDPESALRMILAIVQLCAAVVFAAAAAQLGNADGAKQGEKYTAPNGDAKAAVAGASDLEDPTSCVTSQVGSAVHVSMLNASISRAPVSDIPLDDKCSPAALMREKLRVESKLREARRLVDQLTSTLNILHYCAPLTPRRPFALTSMPRGESLLASLPAVDFELMHSLVSKLNQEALAQCIQQRSAAAPNPLPVVWQQLRDVERLLLHPVALELFKSFLVAQSAHAAFPAVEPVAAVMLILDAKRLHLSEPASLAKLVAHLLSCYLSHCDESPTPPCSLPLSAALRSRFADAVRLWKLASTPNSTASASSAELLATVITLFGEAAVECTHWLALLYLPSFQHSSANKLAQFCVGYTQTMGENADRPSSHTRGHQRQYSDPKTSSSIAAPAAAANQSQTRPPAHTGARRAAGDVSPGGSRQRVHLHLSPTPPRLLRRSSSMEPASPSGVLADGRSAELPAHLEVHLAGLFKPVTPPPEGTLVLSPLSPSSTPPKSHSPSKQMMQQQPQQTQQGQAATGVEHVVATHSNASSTASTASVSGSPLSVPVSPNGAFSTFRLPNTMNHSPAVSLRKAVLIAAQEIVTPSFQSRKLSVENAAPSTLALSTQSASPVAGGSVTPVSPSPPFVPVSGAVGLATLVSSPVAQ